MLACNDTIVLFDRTFLLDGDEFRNETESGCENDMLSLNVDGRDATVYGAKSSVRRCMQSLCGLIRRYVLCSREYVLE